MSAYQLFAVLAHVLRRGDVCLCQRAYLTMVYMKVNVDCMVMVTSSQSIAVDCHSEWHP